MRWRVRLVNRCFQEDGLNLISGQINSSVNTTRYAQRWVEYNVCECLNEWRTDGDKAGARDDLHRWTNGRTAEGAHLLFGIFLIAADLQVILQHSVQRQRDTCYCSRDLLSACARLDIARRDRQFPLMNLSGEQINYTAKAALVHVGEWGSGQWMEHFAAKNLPDVQLLELGEESQIVFSPGNFLSDNRWPTAKNSLET